VGLVSRDEEESIHEDEFILLDDILSGTSGVNQKVLQDILTLTILSEEDYDLIQVSLRLSDFTTLTSSDKISPILREILSSLQKNKGIPHRVYIQQHTSMTDGNRYRWKGRMNTPTQEIGALSVRNRDGVDIINQNSIYVVQNTKNGRWIVGDHQMAIGFGLVSGKPFPARKGWSTVNTGTAIYNNGLSGYKSSTGLKRTRGIAVEKNTDFGLISISGGQTGQTLKRQNNFLRGTWQYKNEATHMGTVFAQGIRSVFASYELGNIRWGGELAFGSGSPSLVVGFNYKIRGFKYLVQFRDIYAESTGAMGNPMVEWKGSDMSERGIFQGAIIRAGKTRIMIYSDVFKHHIRQTKGYEFGIRSETKKGRHHVVFQIKTEKKDKTLVIIYTPIVSPSSANKDGVKIEHRYDAKNWRTNVKYQFVRAGDIQTDHSHGLDLRFHLYQKNYKIELDWMMARVGSFDSRIYFWDVNLPGEMLTRVMSRSSHSQGGKVLFNLSNGSRFGFKIRAVNKNLSFDSGANFSGGIFIQTTL